MSTESPNYAIARLDLPSACTHGWQVRLQRRGIKYAKFFADGPHGSAENALHAARAWRNDLLDRFENEERARICQRSPRNSSGVVGVSKVSVTTNGTTYTFWQATWSPEPGKRKSVKFSIKRHGDTVAFEMAVSARIEAIGH